MASDSDSSGCGCGCIFALFGLMFVVLKLFGAIGWPWWWVLCPFAVPPVLFLLSLLVVGMHLFLDD